MSGFKNKLEIQDIKEISKSIKYITHSGCKSIDSFKLKEIKQICTKDTRLIEHAFSKLMLALKENHSEVRLSAVLLCDEMFRSFQKFRELLIDSIDTFLKYTFGNNFNQELPPPKSSAICIIQKTIRMIDEWNTIYGTSIPKLQSTFNHLKYKKNIDFQKLEVYDPIERARKEKEEERISAINKELLNKTTSEMEEILPEIEVSLTSIQSCFDLLIPSPDNFVDINNEKSINFNSSDNLRLHGLYKNNQSIEVDLLPENHIEIAENEENIDIIENARELYAVITKKYLPKTKAWGILISKTKGNELLQNRADLLEKRLQEAVVKYEKLKLIGKGDDDEVSTDSELEEVETEKDVVKPLVKVSEPCSFLSVGEVSSNQEVKKVAENQVSERKKKLLEVAPKLHYDSDLYEWGEEKKKQTIIPTSVEGHRFWASSSIESIEVPSETVRVIEFTGQFVPVTRACSAPLPSGKLCTRHDRIKCPFHGLIVDRDEKGNIINPEDKQKVKKSIKKEEVPDWQDPKLLAEIKLSTGIDLKIQKGRKMKRKHPNLTDIKKTPTVKEKLSKKIFKKSSLKRVAKTLDTLDYKRHRDKFGDQFNYVHST